jgi:hypothetical protein
MGREATMKNALAHPTVLGCAVLFAGAFMLGCSSAPPDIKDMATVKGSVTYGGKPVPYAGVHFYKGELLRCIARVEAGSYETLLLPGDYNVAIVTMIEPKELQKLVMEGPPDLIGVEGGRIPERRKADGVQPENAPDPASRFPTLSAVMGKMSAGDRAIMEAVQKKYAKPDSSGLNLKVIKGEINHDFEL